MLSTSSWYPDVIDVKWLSPGAAYPSEGCLFKIHLKGTPILIGQLHYTCIVDTADKSHVDTQLLQH